MLGKNNLRIILGSKSEIFTNIEAWQKIRYSYKKVCTVELNCLGLAEMQIRADLANQRAVLFE